jgi:hypothetical protein
MASIPEGQGPSVRAQLPTACGGNGSSGSRPRPPSARRQQQRSSESSPSPAKQQQPLLTRRAPPPAGPACTGRPASSSLESSDLPTGPAARDLPSPKATRRRRDRPCIRTDSDLPTAALLAKASTLNYMRWFCRRTKSRNPCSEKMAKDLNEDLRKERLAAEEIVARDGMSSTIHESNLRKRESVRAMSAEVANAQDQHRARPPALCKRLALPRNPLRAAEPVCAEHRPRAAAPCSRQAR